MNESHPNIASGIKVRYDKNWGKWQILLVALLSFLALKPIFLTLNAGFVAITIIVMAFGSLVLTNAKWKTKATPWGEHRFIK
ncbi:hypothetical protein [Ekhidna sp.]